MEEDKKNLENAWAGLFGGQVSGTGEEELLRVASSFSRQYSSAQMRALLLLKYVASMQREFGSKQKANVISNFVDSYETYKQFHNSDMFVMKALESISLRKFINENTLKINLDKK